jgi:segregation and condensation protein B
LRGEGLIAAGPRSPQPGAPYTYITTNAFLSLYGFASLRDLPDMEEAGLLSKDALLTEGREAFGFLAGSPDNAVEDMASLARRSMGNFPQMLPGGSQP